jgi:phospholipid/cholesterol/gamma-HCH transport system substrate-binding protein
MGPTLAPDHLVTDASGRAARGGAATPGKRTGWRALIPGVLILLGLAAFTVSVLVFARLGRLRGDTYRVRMLTDAARGVIKGTDVWLAGQKVGLVSSIDFASPARDTMARLLIELELVDDVRELIRRDSHAQIRSGGSLIGAPVVYLSVGTPATPRLEAGDTVPAKPQVDTEGLTSAVAMAGKQIPQLIRDVRRVGDELHSATSRLSEVQDNGGVSLEVVGSRAAGISRRATRGQGVLPRLMRERTIAERVSNVMRSADSVRALLASDANAVGRFRRDSTLMREVASVRDEMSILRALIGQSQGTAGRLANDRAVTAALASAEKEMTRTIEDLKRDPLRYVRF